MCGEISSIASRNSCIDANDLKFTFRKQSFFKISSLKPSLVNPINSRQKIVLTSFFAVCYKSRNTT